jgi:hypothetical protein
MSSKTSAILPEWSPRLPMSKIQRLYDLDALGIYDEELIDEIGYALLSRCQSFIQAVQATQGLATCPVCKHQVEHNFKNSEVLTCENCGWQATWKDYFSTIQHKQLSGAEPVLVFFAEFIETYPKARTSQEKMFHIDRLLHGFHYASIHHMRTPTRPVAVNLIDGRLNDVIAFLERLTFGEQSTPGLTENRDEWLEKIQNAKSWGKKT